MIFQYVLKVSFRNNIFQSNMNKNLYKRIFSWILFQNFDDFGVRCPQCYQTYPHRKALRRHMIIHNGEKKYKCGLCTMAFYSKDKLDRHLRTHTGEKSQCQFCEKGFSRPEYLKKHLLKVHEFW